MRPWQRMAARYPGCGYESLAEAERAREDEVLRAAAVVEARERLREEREEGPSLLGADLIAKLRACRDDLCCSVADAGEIVEGGLLEERPPFAETLEAVRPLAAALREEKVERWLSSWGIG